MKLTIISVILISMLSTLAYGQEAEEEAIKHHHFVISIAHSRLFLEEEVNGSNSFLIPTWGFNYEYLFTKKIGLGLKNDLEIAEYVVVNNEGEEVEFGKRWDLAPEFSYELKDGHTGAISLGLSVGIRIGT